MEIISTINDFQHQVNKQQAVIFYFSNDNCSVCKVLLPKVEELIEEEFPLVQTFYINTQNSADIAAQNRIFVAPTVLIYFEGKQYFQFSRNFSLNQLKEAIKRPYQLIFQQSDQPS
jgi:thioredoxin-like negative regulator of GroEL